MTFIRNLILDPFVAKFRNKNEFHEVSGTRDFPGGGNIL